MILDLMLGIRINVDVDLNGKKRAYFPTPLQYIQKKNHQTSRKLHYTWFWLLTPCVDR